MTQEHSDRSESCRPRLAVIIVSWNVREDLQACLQSVFEGNSTEDYEVIVVDNNSTDGTVAMVKEHFPRVRLIENRHNAGFAAANNHGLQAAEAQYYLLLNPDTIVPESAFETLLEFADSHPQAGVIGPKQVYPDGTLQSSCRRFPTITAAMFRHTLFGRLFPQAASPRHYLMADWDHSEPREVDWVSGAAMLIRDEALQEVGLLDEGFFWGSEDVDYCFRMHKAGWKVMYTPEPTIIHAIGKSTNQVVVPTIIRTHRSMGRLYSKHLARNPFTRALVTIGVWARAGLLVASHWLRLGWSKLKRLFKPRRPHD